MVDYFAILGEPRRPQLDPERIKDTFHRLSRERHPDQAGGGNEAFAELNLAQETLRDPKLRLRHLLELEYPELRAAGPAVVPAALAEEFAPVHELLRRLGEFLSRKAAASGALARALLAREEGELRAAAQERLARLERLMDDASKTLAQLDAAWAPRPADAGARLHELYGQLAYLTRWLEQLREGAFQLAL